MKISLADKGIWINRDNKNDVHIHPEVVDALLRGVLNTIAASVVAK